MAQVTRVEAVLETATPPTNSLIGGYRCGEAVLGLDALCIKAADGLLWKASGAADNELARCVGFAAVKRSAGRGVTILKNVVVAYASGMTPGTFLWLSSTTPGGLQTTAPANAPFPVAYVMDAESIFVFGTMGYLAGLGELATMAANIPTAAVADIPAIPAAAGEATAASLAETQALRAGHNDLLAKLRTAGIITP